MATSDIGLKEINRLEAEIARLVHSGRESELPNLWARILHIDPVHERTLVAMGQYAFRRGDASLACETFRRLCEVHGANPKHWVNLALACQSAADEPGEDLAIAEALKRDPTDLLALILRANLYERRGDRHKAATAHGAVAAVAPPVDNLHPDLRPAVQRAMAYKEQYDKEFGRYLDDFLAPHLASCKEENLGRFRDSVDIMVGRKRRYESTSMMYHYPGLVPVEFFDRALFPWLDAFEDSTETIGNEFLAAQKDNSGFEPYIQYSADLPLNQWAGLNHSKNWEAFHLFKAGARVEENANKCPATMGLLATAPQPIQAGRTPAAMFSLLKPRIRIPPHTGVTNARLVTHVPLIVPPDCGFRVGNSIRQWRPGEAFVFDDTIEHEAWNNSDQLRVVLIFDIWHPALSLAERAMVTALAEGINAFTGESLGFEL